MQKLKMSCFRNAGHTIPTSFFFFTNLIGYFHCRIPGFYFTSYCSEFEFQREKKSAVMMLPETGSIPILFYFFSS